MRVLYVVPYSPFREHDHAANEMVPNLVRRLARHTDLHVYTPGPLSDQERRKAADEHCTVVEGPPLVTPRVRATLGKRPFWQNGEWPSAQRAAARAAIARLRPDIVHGEYLQVGDTVCDYPSSILNFHDITTDIMFKQLKCSNGATRGYRYVEYLRTRTLERNVTRNVRIPVAISEPVLTVLRTMNSNAILIRPGVDVPTVQWRPLETEPPRLLFTGAMWRGANVTAARVLIDQVMPLVWKSRPNTVLRIAGAQPPATLLALRNNHIEVVGRVASLDAEMLAADVSIAATSFGGGLLFKAVRPMALGCPVVMGRNTAAAIGANDTQVRIADTPEEVARAALELVADSALATRLGACARALIAERYQWDKTIDSYLAAYSVIASEQ